MVPLDWTRTVDRNNGPKCALAGFLFTGVALGNLLVGLTYVEALQYTKSIVENDALLN